MYHILYLLSYSMFSLQPAASQSRLRISPELIQKHKTPLLERRRGFTFLLTLMLTRVVKMCPLYVFFHFTDDSSSPQLQQPSVHNSGQINGSF